MPSNIEIKLIFAIMLVLLVFGVLWGGFNVIDNALNGYPLDGG